MTLVSPNRGYLLERIEGDTGTMSWWAGQLTRVRDGLDELRDAAGTTTALPGVGRAVTAVRGDAADLLAALAPDIAEAEHLSRVIETYADAYDRCASPANAMIEEIELAHASWAQAEAAADDAGRAALAAAYGTSQPAIDVTTALANEAIDVRDAAAQTLDALWVEYERHHSGWDAAYGAALAALALGATSSLSPRERTFLESLLAGGDPAEVLRVWRAHPELHDELVSAHPDVIGNLDGIPYDVRAQANRSHLESLLADEEPGDRRDDLEAVMRALNAEGMPRPALISFDPDGSEQVTAAIAHGDLAAASEINSLVPGMNSNVHDLASWGESAKALNRSVGPHSATVVWFGYDSPDLLEEPRMGRAIDGAAAFGAYLDGMRALSPQADINVVAHSYGSTTAALAIGSRSDGHGVTSFIAVGSAGFPGDETVRENLSNSRATQVYATISEDDATARIGRATAPGHPVAPEHLPGVRIFDSDGGVSRTGDDLQAATGHGALGPGAYLEPGSESFYNVSEIIRTGEPGTQRQGQGSTKGFWDASNWWISDEFELIDF
ncbi:alpha/beta hydrolase [Microbacterium sp. NPDC089318]